MNPLEILSYSPLVQRFGWVLIHFLWEGTAIALLAWLVLGLMRKASAQSRYLVLCGALLACAVAPCLTWELLQGRAASRLAPEFSAVREGKNLGGMAGMTGMTGMAGSEVKPLEGDNLKDSGGMMSLANSGPAHRAWNSEAVVSAVRARLPRLVILWGVGVIVLSLRMLYGGTQIRLLRASGRPSAKPEWEERLSALARRMGLLAVVGRVKLLESARVDVPTVIGWLKPVVLVPFGFLASLPAEQVEAILAHELAHIRRHDFLVNLFQILIETVLFYHPAVWWISCSIRVERENCCDDLALEIVGSKLTYAIALTAVEESRASTAALSMAASGGQLLSRISRLMRPEESASKAGGVLVAIGLALLLAFGASVHQANAKPKEAGSDRFTTPKLTQAAQPAAAKTIELHLIDPEDKSPVSDAKILVESYPEFKSTLKTDSSGVAKIALPVERPAYVTVRAQKPGRVPRLVCWSLDQPAFSLPNQYELKMEKAHTIGGVVKNEQGQPIAGAKVVLIIRWSSGSRSEQVFDDIWERRVTTDKLGKWHFDEAPSNLEPLSVKLEHPNYISNQRLDSFPPTEAFKSGNAVLVMKRGMVCEGSVRDETGKPVPNVKVVYGNDGSDSTTHPSTKTDAKGHFRFGALPEKDLSFNGHILTFFSDKYAPELIELSAQRQFGALEVKLSKGSPARFKVVDSKGNPLKDAWIKPDHWGLHRPFGCFRWQTKADGTYTWEHAPAAPIKYCVLAEGFQREEPVVEVGGEVRVIVLKKQTLISGKVIDAETKAPVENFKLIEGRSFPDHPTYWSDWDRRSTTMFHSGSYQHRFEEPASMGTGNAKPSTPGFHRLRVEAEGYAPGISRLIANEEETGSIDFELKKAAASIKGQVTNAGGKPIKGAQIVVAGLGNAVQITNGAYSGGQDKLVILTDDNGRYELPAQEENFAIAIVDPDAGYAVTSFEQLQQTPNVALKPWGILQVKGRFNGKDKPPLFLNYPGHGGADERIRFESEAQAKGEGLAEFSHLTAGKFSVRIFYVPVGGNFVAPLYEVESGKTTLVDWQKGKRAVTGKVQLPPGQVNFERIDFQITPRPAPLIPENLSRQEKHDWYVKWQKSPEGIAYNSKVQFMRAHRDSDGNASFVCEYVPPGKYQLSGYIEQASGGLVVKKEFELPEGTTDFDLGVMVPEKQEASGKK